MMPKRIAIIGGGLSGLATAFYLRRFAPDAAVSLLEATDRVGGVIATESVEVPGAGRFVIDHGADMFAVNPPAALQLCKDLGVEDQLIIPDAELAGAMIVHRGKLVPIPDGFVLMRATKLTQMVTTPLLSLPAKIRFLAERFIRHQELAPDEDVSVAEFVRKRMGQEALDRLIGPLVAGIYTADVEKLSLKATMGPMLEMVREHGSLAQATLARRKKGDDATERQSAGARYQNFRGFPGGMQQLLDTLVDRIGQDVISTQSPVSGLNYDPGGKQWQVESPRGIAEFDQVVLAAPQSVAGRLLSSVKETAVADPCGRASKGLMSIPAASTAIVVLCVRKDRIRQLPAKFGFVVPAIEDRRILAGSFASHKYSVRCPDDHTIIRVFVGGQTRPELLEIDDEGLVELVREELAELIGLEGDETLQRVVRWNNAMPQYHVGHLNVVERIENAIDEIPALSLATNAMRGVGIAPVIGRAKDVAQSIADEG